MSLAAKYRPDIDGLRAVAVLAVVIYHAFPHALPGGFVGVDVFFVISGFLISSIILSGVADGTFTYREFYGRRLRRIGPALLVVLTATLLAGWFVLSWRDYQNLARHVVGGLAFVSNFLLWKEAGYFDAAAETKPLLHLWSLGIEEQFYIFWPLVLGFAWRWRWAIGLVISIVGVCSFLANVAIVHRLPDAAFYSPVTRIWELLIGAGLAWWPIRRSGASLNKPILSWLGAALLLLGLVLVDRSKAFPGWWALLPAAGTAMIISAGPGSWVNSRLLSTPVAVWFGKISYPLYLWHWPIFSLALIGNNMVPLSSEKRLALVGASVAAAWLTYQLVERPIRFRGWIHTGALAGSGGAVAALAIAVFMLSGFPNRQINNDAARAFVKRYEEFQRGAGAYYPFACDFYAGDTPGGKSAIDPSCTNPQGGPELVLLWGDSHAQAMSWGIRQVLPPSERLAQIVTSGCRPWIAEDPTNGGADKGACAKSTAFAREFITTHRPSKVIVAQREDHEKVDWLEMRRFIEANGGKLLVVGPVPQWNPALPVIVSNYKGPERDYMTEGLISSIMETDKAMKSKFAGTSLRYASLMDTLCNREGCRVRIASADPFNLTVMDYGHMTPAASIFVANAVVRPFLQDQAP